MGKYCIVNVAPLVCFCVLLIGAVRISAENILISASLGEGSHYFVGKTVGKYLAKHGHNVTVLLSEAFAHRAENPDDSELNFIIFKHSVPTEDVIERLRGYSKVALEPFGISYMLQLVESQLQGNLNDCEDLLTRNPEVMHRLEQGDFRAVVVDQIWPCSLLLAMKLNATVVLSNPMSQVVFMSTVIGNPVNLAYMPAGATGLTYPMTFFQRVSNVLSTYVTVHLVVAHFINAFDDVRTRHGIRPDITGSIQDLLATYPELYLWNMDFAVEPPCALNPNIIATGGITATPAKPLPDDLEQFVQGSGEAGVIVFTLGTYVHNIRPDYLRPFAEAFGRLPQRVVWQMKGEPPFELPINVRTMPWLPQNDLLGHPKTRLFIFHGGNNGFYEAQYHGVPVIIIPLIGDAIDAGALAARRGFGKTLDKFDVTSETLLSATDSILSNDSYSKTMARQSTLMRSRPMHPGDKAAFWIEHVIKYGGQHLKTPANDLNFIQRNLVDVFAFLFAVISCMLTIIFLFVRCMFRCCKRVCCGWKEKQE